MILMLLRYKFLALTVWLWATDWCASLSAFTQLPEILYVGLRLPEFSSIEVLEKDNSPKDVFF